MKIILKTLLLLIALSAVPVFAQSDFEATRARAEAGDSESQVILGNMYRDGVHVGKNEVEAVSWYRLAADKGFVSGQYHLGLMYFFGLGIARDQQEAAKWIELSAQQGLREAQNHFALMHSIGAGVAKSEGEAFNWYMLAANQGLAEAQFFVGSMYSRGLGVAQSYEEAAEWYLRAAAQGDSFAQLALSEMYACGRGVRKDTLQARRWYRPTAGRDFQSLLIQCSTQDQRVSSTGNSSPSASTAEQIESWRNLCISYGFKADTDALAECIQREIQSRTATLSATPTDGSNANAAKEEQEIARLRRAEVNFCKAAMFGRPTRTGDFAESAMLALQCDSNPRAHLNEPAPNYRCRTDIMGALICEAY